MSCDSCIHKAVCQGAKNKVRCDDYISERVLLRPIEHLARGYDNLVSTARWIAEDCAALGDVVICATVTSNEELSEGGITVTRGIEHLIARYRPEHVYRRSSPCGERICFDVLGVRIIGTDEEAL